MSGATEIYLCKAGQSLKQGRVEYSDSIENKADAEADAIERCRFNKFYAKLAYYAVSENGDFRCIFTYNNPNVSGSVGEKQEEKKKKVSVKKLSIIERVVGSLTGSTKKSKKGKKVKKKKTAGKKSKTA
ncbi:MAG: hypothetical protein HQ504_03130 [Rhodospirillaceae bacterium]|nr:hypothetical protein [Rhodospirillaceae bacterium]